MKSLPQPKQMHYLIYPWHEKLDIFKTALFQVNLAREIEFWLKSAIEDSQYVANMDPKHEDYQLLVAAEEVSRGAINALARASAAMSQDDVDLAVSWAFQAVHCSPGLPFEFVDERWMGVTLMSGVRPMDSREIDAILKDFTPTSDCIVTENEFKGSEIVSRSQTIILMDSDMEEHTLTRVRHLMDGYWSDTIWWDHAIGTEHAPFRSWSRKIQDIFN